MLDRGEAKDRLLKLGFEVVGGAPDVLANAMKREIADMGKVIREAGIRDE